MVGFSKVIATLEGYYGRPKPAVARGPFELILYENIAYLVSEDRREKAFRELQTRIGTRPEDVLVASLEELTPIAALGGIFPELRARRLQEAARLVRDEFHGDLRSVLSLDFVKARRALRKFPVIGEPGAEKILLFTGAHARLALESNGVRVLVRLGFAEEHTSYSTTYRRLQDALRDQIGTECAPLVPAHQLLKLHGQELCRRSEPRCPACPLRGSCAFRLGTK
jgi:endonuclease III